MLLASLRRLRLLPIAIPLITSAPMAWGVEPGVTNTSETSFEDQWHFILGAGIEERPKFPGSADTKLGVLPLASATYDRYFIGANPDSGSPLGIGAYLYRDSNWRVGVALSYDFFTPRKQSDDVRLTGLGDVKRTGHASVFGSYALHWISIRGDVSTDIGGQHEGTTASLSVLGRLPITAQLELSAGPGLTWASGQYTSTFYGVDVVQSVASGLPQYSPRSGIASYRFSFGAAYKVDRNWSVNAQATVARLGTQAADSPIVEKRTQLSYGLSVRYRF